MENAPIDTPAKVSDLEGRHYRYLSPYSPFMNPTEEFWSKVKDGVRGNALTANDQLNDRIYESV
jgi:transposase